MEIQQRTTDWRPDNYYLWVSATVSKVSQSESSFISTDDKIAWVCPQATWTVTASWSLFLLVSSTLATSVSPQLRVLAEFLWAQQSVQSCADSPQFERLSEACQSRTALSSSSDQASHSVLARSLYVPSQQERYRLWESKHEDERR